MHDAVIVGAGVAGCAAAVALAAHKRRVIVIDRDDPRKAPAQSAWIGRRATDALKTLNVADALADMTPIRSLRFHSADFAQKTDVMFDKPLAGLINVQALRAALLNAAKSGGATLRFGHAVSAIRPDETCVRLRLADHDDEPSGRFAVLAVGCQEGAADLIPAATHRTRPASFRARVVVPRGAGPNLKKGGPGSVHVVLDVGVNGLGFFWADGDTLVLDVSGGDRATTVANATANLAQTLVRAGCAGEAAVRTAKKPHVFASPAGEALEADTHVVKRGLIIGEAGGFVGAASHEGLYPALESAILAADVLHKALDADEPQDQLHAFETRWRTSFAMSLQPLDSDMRFLQPLVFSNAAIATKVAKSILGCPD